MTRITVRTRGMMRALSCSVVVRVSRSVAVAPPMRAAPDSSVRNSRTMSMASSLSAVAVRVASSMTSPLSTVGAGGGVPGRPTDWIPALVTGAEPEGEDFETTLTEATPSLSSSWFTTDCRVFSAVKT